MLHVARTIRICWQKVTWSMVSFTTWKHGGPLMNYVADLRPWVLRPWTMKNSPPGALTHVNLFSPMRPTYIYCHRIFSFQGCMRMIRTRWITHERPRKVKDNLPVSIKSNARSYVLLTVRSTFTYIKSKVASASGSRRHFLYRAKRAAQRDSGGFFFLPNASQERMTNAG